MHPTRILALFGCLVLAPAALYAQASVAGVVKDTSGAVLPGVTVEASSPALIEKTRSVVTDNTGRYSVVDLRPGVYSVSFTLPGFNTVKREGIELTGSFTATIDAELRVGAVEETLTVTGETPVVDIRNARQQQAIDREIIAAVPSGRAFQHIVTLIPAMQNQGGAQDVGGIRGPASTSDRYIVHGGLVTDSRVMVEGLGVGSATPGGASGTFYLPPMGASQEVVVTTSGGMGEAETGGVIVNIVPREGGNTIQGSFFGTGANSSMQGSNYTAALQKAGLRAPNHVYRVWDINPAIGGPVFTDKLWYYVSERYSGANNYVAGMYHNLNAGNPNAWTYAPDLSRQAINFSHAWSTAVRLTWQASARNKVNFFWDEQPRCVSCPGGTAVQTPEATGRSNGNPNRVQQVTWSSPLTNRVLLDAGFGTYIVRWSWKIGPPETPELVRVTEQAGIIPGLSYRAPSLSDNHNESYNWRAAFSYVTGAHSTQVGYRASFYDVTPNSAYTLNGGLSFRLNEGVPNQLTQTMDSFPNAHMKVHALYAQDQWTIDRLTLQGAVRYDHFGSWFPDQQVGPTNFQLVPIVFPGHSGVSFNDITSRVAAVYDLFGNGKTALKVTLGKYMLGQESSSAGTFGSFMGPINRLATTTTRSWADANRDFVPNCDLTNRAANGECGAMANQNFGTNVFSINYDPAVINGWGIRPYSWEFSTSVQQEILPRIAANVAFFRRWYGNFAVTDNIATEASDYTTFNLPLPVDARLPNSGGTVTGIVDVNPAKFGQVNNIVTSASNYGKMVQRWQGVDIGLNVRPQNGVFFQGGISVGKTLTDRCEVSAKLPEMNLTVLVQAAGGYTNNVWVPQQYCHVETPFLPQYKGLGGYTIPRVDVALSATFQNIPGPDIQANWNVPNATVASLIGRNLAGNAANIPVGIIAPFGKYQDRLTQIDIRMAKILRFGRTRTQVALDLYNAFNSSAIQTQNNTYGAAWLTPTLTIDPRLAKVSVQFDF